MEVCFWMFQMEFWNSFFKGLIFSSLKLICPLKRDYFDRKYMFQPLIFRRHVSFPGSVHLSFGGSKNVLKEHPGLSVAWKNWTTFAPINHGTTKKRRGPEGKSTRKNKKKHLASRWFNSWPFWNGENVTLSKVVGDLQLVGDKSRSRIESPGRRTSFFVAIRVSMSRSCSCRIRSRSWHSSSSSCRALLRWKKSQGMFFWAGGETFNEFFRPI